MIEIAEEFGTKVYYGDGTRIDLLRTAGADDGQGDRCSATTMKAAS